MAGAAIRRFTMVVLLTAACSSGEGSCFESPLQPTSPSATLTSIAVACQPVEGNSPTSVYCLATACFSDRSIQGVTPVATWESSDSTVATVERGVARFHSTGEVIIRATHRWQDGAPVTGYHPLVVTETGCSILDPTKSRLCDGARGGVAGVTAPGGCPAPPAD